MDNYRYSLEKGSKKYHCPNCSKKTLKRYIDIETSDYLPEKYGRCDRESKCSYHLNPYLEGYTKVISEQEKAHLSELPSNWKSQRKIALPQPKNDPIFFDFETFRQTLHYERYAKNTFIQNLFHRVQFPFEDNDVTKVIELYRLGTVANGYRAGAATFPFIDVNGNVRTVQVKEFDALNHTKSTDFLHSIIEKHLTINNKPLPEWLRAYLKQDKRVSCLFGEHLLSKHDKNPVALVEAPKTAVYGTLYFGIPEKPESLIWLAVFNKSSFSFDKLKVLQGRTVVIFPDLSKGGSTFKEWKNKAKEYESRLPGTRFIFSDLLEQLALEKDKNEGNDLADYLIKHDWRLYRKISIQEQKLFHEPLIVDEIKIVQSPKNMLLSNYSKLPKDELSQTNILQQYNEEQSKNWDEEILELETFYMNTELPSHPVKLNKCTTIENCVLFVESHLNAVRSNNGNKTFLPYLERLQELKKVLNKDPNCY